MILFAFRDCPKDKYALHTMFCLFCPIKNQCGSCILYHAFKNWFQNTPFRIPRVYLILEECLCLSHCITVYIQSSDLSVNNLNIFISI
jgi:hypothetical protein